MLRTTRLRDSLIACDAAAPWFRLVILGAKLSQPTQIKPGQLGPCDRECRWTNAMLPRPRQPLGQSVATTRLPATFGRLASAARIRAREQFLNLSQARSSGKRNPHHRDHIRDQQHAHLPSVGLIRYVNLNDAARMRMRHHRFAPTIAPSLIPSRHIVNNQAFLPRFVREANPCQQSSPGCGGESCTCVESRLGTVPLPQPAGQQAGQ